MVRPSAMSRRLFFSLLVPGVALGLLYWITVGWLDDTYDTTQAGRVIVTGIYSVFFIGLWAFVAAVAAALVTRVRRPTGRS
jgi:TRAP-type C4-dicarboxylate transport system permease large subunit